MPRLVAALFDDRARAESALEALITTGVARDRITIISEARHPTSELAPGRFVPARDEALAALRGLALPEEDVSEFAAGLGRGGVLIAARVDGENTEAAVRTLEIFDPADLDGRSEASRGGGADPDAGSGPGAPLGAGLTGGTGPGTTNTETLPGMRNVAQDTSVLGTADLRTDEASLSDQGMSTTATGGGRGDARAGEPGVNELGGQPDRHPTHRREMAGVGRVRSYISNLG